MWIVKVALSRPYTFVVLALLLLLTAPVIILRTPMDIFPSINVPVVSIIWTFTGLAPSEMESRITSIYERALTTTVDNIEHIESQSLNGVAVVKVYLQPRTNVDGAIAEVIAEAQATLKQLPPGITPPLVIRYDASTVPVLQLGLGGQGLSEQQLNDLGVNFIRPQLATIPGAAVPIPYGGKVRQIMVDIDSQELTARGLSATDVVNGVNAQNVILPSGTAKIGPTEYNVGLNGTPVTVAQLNDIPLRSVNGATVYLRDVAHVRDGYAVQTNIVRQDGQRGVLLAVQKAGDASTLAIVSGIRALLPRIAASLPQQLVMRPILDQSVFVRASLQGVVREALIAAGLTSLLILLFLGSWRSTLIICVSIPLSILASVLALSALGETINIMTLGGLALAVGILVDDATVEIENVERQLGLGKGLREAILDGARQIAVPAFVSTVCISIVFVPMFFLSGVARYLFVPMAEAVVFALFASYFFSRTLVPTLVLFLLRKEVAHRQQPRPAAGPGWFRRVHARFEHGFAHLREAYSCALQQCLRRRGWFTGGFLAFCLVSLSLYPLLGNDFFPTVDTGQFRLHVRAKTGTRIEETARLVDQVERTIRATIPPGELAGLLDNIGLPTSGINLSYANSGAIGSGDAEILGSLQPRHRPTSGYVAQLRKVLPRQFPSTEFFFQPADIVSQTLNFGLPAAIDVQIIGTDRTANFAAATHLAQQMRAIPGAVDVHVQQLMDQPRLQFDLDRVRAQQLGLTARDVSSGLLVSLSSSFQTSPNLWLNPQNGVSYNIAVQTPQYRINSLDALRSIPVTGTSGGAQLFENLTSMTQTQEPAVASHYNVQPVIDIYAGVQGRDLGSVAAQVRKLTDAAGAQLPKGSFLVTRGQVATMHSSFTGLLGGLAFAIALVYLLLVVNFQSWSIAFIIITALPGALAGICWMLFLSHTSLSVPALTGAIMCVGVATANSVLVVTFANERLAACQDALQAALEAGATRLRPVVMTALAMIIGMLPMALGLGEGGEQNAPLGRAVIGGLLFATVATLFFVPTVFALVRSRFTGSIQQEAPAMNDLKSPLETRNSVVIADGANGTGRRTFLWFASIPAILCGLGAIALIVRSGDGRALAVDAHASTTLTVDIIHAQRDAAANEIVLPGTLQAYDESPVYARTSGYVRKWYVDIGQRVKAGQLLVEIDAPEVDQQLQHARAVLNQVQASLSLADVTARRYRQLIKLDAVSQQQVDQNEQNLLAQQANVKAASADVANLQQQKAYEKVVAPFDGIVTARHTDIGDLINAGNGGPGAELFRVSRTSTMRTFVSVPEEYSQQIRDGMHVSLELTELPGERFEGSVTRSAGAINVQSRTLLVEVDVLNASERLMPGAYAKVHIGLAQSRQSLLVPAGSILFQTAGPQIAVVDPAQHIELRKVSIGIDYGNSVEITSGITPDDPIVANPPDYVLAGMPVSVRRTVGQPQEPGNGVVHSPK